MHMVYRVIIQMLERILFVRLLNLIFSINF